MYKNWQGVTLKVGTILLKVSEGLYSLNLCNIYVPYNDNSKMTINPLPLTITITRRGGILQLYNLKAYVGNPNHINALNRDGMPTNKNKEFTGVYVLTESIFFIIRI